VRISLKSKRDEGMLELLLGSLDPSLRLAFDFEHPSWDGIEPRLAEAGAVRVGDLEHPAPFRYLRRREPPDEAFAAAVAAASEPSRSSSIPSSRFLLSEIRIGPSRSPSRRTRPSNSATTPGRSPGSFGANSKPSGACSAQRTNCSSAGSR